MHLQSVNLCLYVYGGRQGKKSAFVFKDSVLFRLLSDFILANSFILYESKLLTLWNPLHSYSLQSNCLPLSLFCNLLLTIKESLILILLNAKSFSTEGIILVCCIILLKAKSKCTMSATNDPFWTLILGALLLRSSKLYEEAFGT